MRETQQKEGLPQRLRGLGASAALLCGLGGMTGCGRAPSFNILGSFFPAWLICMIIGVVLAAITDQVLTFYKLENRVAWKIVVYPCLALFFSCALWLIFFS